MSENDNESKAIVVLTQEEIDRTIHRLEEASIGLDDAFQERYGDIYRKFHAIEKRGSRERISGEIAAETIGEKKRIQSPNQFTMTKTTNIELSHNTTDSQQGDEQ